VSEGWAGQFVTLRALGAGLAAIPLVSPGIDALGALCRRAGDRLGMERTGDLRATARRGTVATARAGRGDGRHTAVAVTGHAIGRVTWPDSRLALDFQRHGGIAPVLMGWSGAPCRMSRGRAPAQRADLRQILAIPGVRPVLLVAMLWFSCALSVLHLHRCVPRFRGLGGPTRCGAADPRAFHHGGVVGGRMAHRPMPTRRAASFRRHVRGLGSRVRSLRLIACGDADGRGAVASGFQRSTHILQTALADTAGKHADAAQSMLATVFNLSFAGSGLLRGVLPQTVGSSMLPWMLATLPFIAWLIAWRCQSRGFPAGR